MGNEKSTTRILRFKDLFELIGLSRTTIIRFEKNGTFPKRRQLGPNSIGWLESDVLAWISAKSLKSTMHLIIRDRQDFAGNELHPEMFDELIDALGLTPRDGDYSKIEQISFWATNAKIEE